MALTKVPNPSVTYHLITDAEAWRCVDLQAVVPGEPAWKPSMPCHKALIMPFGRIGNVAAHCCLKGFPRWTMAGLKSLYQALDCKPPGGERPPATERGLLAALGKRLLGDAYSEEVLNEIVEAKTKIEEDGDDLISDSPIAADDPSGVLEDIMDDEDLLHELQLAKQKMKQHKAKMQTKAKQLQDESKASMAASSSASASKKRKQPHLKPGGLSQVEAAALAPPGCSVSKEAQWHHRWRIKAKYVTGKTSFGFKHNVEGADNDALKQAMRVAWAEWCKTSGSTCPFDWS